MSKNIILKTISEVRSFQRTILKAIAINENQSSFLILSNDIIFDTEALKQYLIENDLNEFAQNEITNLINIIDSYLELGNSYLNLPKSDNHFNYEYTNKAKGFGTGDVKFFLKDNDTFLRTENKTFDEKEPLFRYFKHFNYNWLANRLKEIKHLISINREPLLKATKTNNDIEVWKSEYELRQFIDTATRWSIESVFDSITENSNYSIFDYEVKNSRQNYELFCTQLINKLTENNNWKAIEIDLKDRFLGMLNQYINWYKLNSKETEKFNPYNPYELMFSIIESTKKEIIKYFPDIEIQKQPQQIETNKPDEVKKELHNAYFKNNAFEVWQSMFDEFEINEKSRTDVKFMFEEMKKEGLIHKTVNQTIFLEWITSTYNGLIVEKTSNHNRTKTRLQAYSRAIQLYKK